MKKKTIVLLITFLIAGLLFFQIQFNFLNNLFNIPYAISGTSTLSLSQANLQSSNPFLSGKVWLLTFSAGGLGQSYFGKFSPSDVQSATSDQSTTTNDFTINVEYADQIWNYPIQQTSLNKPIYDIQYQKWTCILPTSESGAKSKTGFSSILWYGTDGLTCWAVGYNLQSPVGNIQNPTLSSSYTITITTPSGSASKTLNINSGSSQGAVGNYAYASWLGNLGSGLTHPSQSAYKTAYVNGVWRVISSSSYNNYVSQINAVPPSSGSYRDAWVTQLQNAVINAKQSKTFGAINSASSLSSAIIKITSTTPVQFPVTTLYIKASEIGIYTPTPDFRIESTNSQCFRTGEQGIITVTIKNYGESGTGNVYAQCQSPFQVTQNVQLSLTNGESRTILLPLSASASQKTTGSCTVYVESPGGTKSATANTCVDPQITCEANSKFCGVSGTNEVIKQCSSDGATSSIIEICPAGYYCENAKCIFGDRTGKSIFDKIGDFFKNLFSGIGSFFGIIKLIVSIIAGVFSLVFSLDLFGRSETLRKNKWLVWIFGLIIGGLIFWLVMTVFWIGVIIFIIYFVIKIIVGGQLFAFKKAVRRLRK